MPALWSPASRPAASRSRRGATALVFLTHPPAETVGPLVVLRSRDAGAMVARLAARGIALSARRDGVRFAFHVYNTMEDVETALQAPGENLEDRKSTRP